MQAAAHRERVGPHFIWWFSDHIEIDGGSLNFDQTFIQRLDVRRYDALFAEIGDPDGLPLPYIQNPDNTWVHDYYQTEARGRVLGIFCVFCSNFAVTMITVSEIARLLERTLLRNRGREARREA
jgi:hypothetical protein